MVTEKPVSGLNSGASAARRSRHLRGRCQKCWRKLFVTLQWGQNVRNGKCFILISIWFWKTVLTPYCCKFPFWKMWKTLISPLDTKRNIFVLCRWGEIKLHGSSRQIFKHFELDHQHPSWKNRYLKDIPGLIRPASRRISGNHWIGGVEWWNRFYFRAIAREDSHQKNPS